MKKKSITNLSENSCSSNLSRSLLAAVCEKVDLDLKDMTPVSLNFYVIYILVCSHLLTSGSKIGSKSSQSYQDRLKAKIRGG